MDSSEFPSFSSVAPLSGLVLDMVENNLESQEVPALRETNMPNYTDFSSWFSDVEEIENRYIDSLRINREDAVYVFMTDSFFPMDNKGFVNNTSELKDCSEETHNFGYLMLCFCQYMQQTSSSRFGCFLLVSHLCFVLHFGIEEMRQWLSTVMMTYGCLWTSRW